MKVKCSICHKEFTSLKLVMVKEEPLNLCDKDYEKIIKKVTK